MSVHPQTENLIFAPDGTSYIGQKEMSDSNLGITLCINVTVEGDPELSHKIEQLCFSHLEKKVIEQSTGAIEDDFEDALKIINTDLLRLHPGKKKLRLHALLAVSQNGVLYISQTGDAEAYLIRNGSFNIIGESTPSDEADYFVNVASGDIVHKDIVIFSTARLLRFLTSSQLTTIFRETIKDSITIIKESAFANEQDAFGLKILSYKKSGEALVTERPQALQSPKKAIAGLSQMIIRKYRDTSDNRRWVFAGIIGTTVLLVLAVSLLNSNQIESQQLQELQASLTEISVEIKRAENLNIQGKKEEAGNLLDKVSGEISKILETGEYRKEAIALNDQIEKQKEEIHNIQRISEPAVTTDLSQKRSDVDTIGMIGLGSKMYAYEYNALYEIILNVVEEQPLTISNDTSVVLGAAMPDKDALYFYTKDKRLIEYAERRFSFIDTSDPIWKNAIDLAVFNRNLYMIDPSSNQIWKYVRKNLGFSGAQPYFQDNTGIDLGRAISFAIDGSIYVLNNDSTLEQYYRGEKADLNIEQMPKDILIGTTEVFTNVDYQNLYVLNPKLQSVIVIKKDTDGFPATYRKQIVIDNAEDLRDLYVDQTEQKLYVAGKSKIYQISL